MKIASILTCHNRCKKTLNCLNSLVSAKRYWEYKSGKTLDIKVFLTDDGCTDNTIVEVKDKIAPFIPVHIIKGDGNRFWAGGMRDAWNEACKQKWNYYLLLNDDSVLFEDCFLELFKTEEYCLREFGKQGLYSGITTSPGNKTVVTYGGNIWDNRLLGTAHRLPMADKPQRCDLTNANILLVPDCVVDKIGIFYEGYIHGAADYDYSAYANKFGFPVLITANSCGECDFDHTTDEDKPRKIAKMSFNERKKYFSHPVHSTQDYLTYTKRVNPFKYPIVYLGRVINLYFPYLYLLLYKLRVH